jgi:hypothetical protein
MKRLAHSRSIQRFPVVSRRFVQVRVAVRDDLKRFRICIRGWGKLAKRDGSPKKTDAVELAKLAVRRWTEGLSKGRAARNLQDIKDRIVDNPRSEVAVLLVAEAERLSSQRGAIVGFLHFRRTWCNNICVDYLAVSPSIAGEPTSPFGGLGSGMVYSIATAAGELGVRIIWGEATQNSLGFYNKIFDKNKRQDRFSVRRRDYVAFQKRLKRKWGKLMGVTKHVTTKRV